MTTSIASIAGYGTHAAVLAEQYESITFEDIHCGVLRPFPTRPSSVLSKLIR